MRSFAWEHHDNACNYPPQDTGVAYRYIVDWLGRPLNSYDMDEYGFASALLQAEGLMEYANNYRSRMFSSASSIFWMLRTPGPSPTVGRSSITTSARSWLIIPCGGRSRR